MTEYYDTAHNGSVYFSLMNKNATTARSAANAANSSLCIKWSHTLCVDSISSFPFGHTGWTCSGKWDWKTGSCARTVGCFCYQMIGWLTKVTTSWRESPADSYAVHQRCCHLLRTRKQMQYVRVNALMDENWFIFLFSMDDCGKYICDPPKITCFSKTYFVFYYAFKQNIFRGKTAIPQCYVCWILFMSFLEIQQLECLKTKTKSM